MDYSQVNQLKQAKTGSAILIILSILLFGSSIMLDFYIGIIISFIIMSAIMILQYVILSFVIKIAEEFTMFGDITRNLGSDIDDILK